MSDRIAVFDQGQVQQVDSPTAVYEHPSNRFVAGFVGTSNLLEGAAAESVLGKQGTYSIRPEKIRIVELTDEPTGSEHSVTGTVREVEYLGSLTRFHVDLSVGGDLTALQQNVDFSPAVAPQLRGREVRLVWDREHEFRVAEPA